MIKKLKNFKKGQVILFLICLFAISGALCGSVCFSILPSNPVSQLSKAFVSDEKSIYIFLSICIIPYLILFSSCFSFGIALSCVLLFFQSFISSGTVCSAISSQNSTLPILKTALLQSLLILCSMVSSAFSIDRVIQKFTHTQRKRNPKNEKMKTDAENIIIFSSATVILVLYCILKHKLKL